MSEEYITKTQVRELMERYYENANLRQDHFLRSVFRDIKALPAVDAVPVVRCRECYFGRPIKFADGSDMIACEFDGGISRFPDFYCKAGDRKDGADNG